MSSTPNIDALRETVERMEKRYGHLPEIASIYAGLGRRFADDLDDERDILLCTGGALMLIKYLKEAGKLG